MIDNDDDDNVGVDVGIDDGDVCSPRQAVYCWLYVALTVLAELLTSLLRFVVVVIVALPLSMVALRRRSLINDGDVYARQQ